MMRSVRRPFLLLLVADAGLLLAGCSLLSSPKPEPATALLTKIPANVPHEAGVESTLLIARPQTSSAYDTTRMAYTEKPYQIAYYRDNQWAAPPGEMIQPLLVRTLEQTGIFRAILPPSETGHADYALRTEVTELLQDYTASTPVLRLTLHLQLLDGAGQALADREITEQVAMRGSNSYAGVNAANDALARALAEAAQFVMSSARSETKASSARSGLEAGSDVREPRQRADR
jgi:cholesterol transport system auxiliary component